MTSADCRSPSAMREQPEPMTEPRRQLLLVRSTSLPEIVEDFRFDSLRRSPLAVSLWVEQLEEGLGPTARFHRERKPLRPTPDLIGLPLVRVGGSDQWSLSRVRMRCAQLALGDTTNNNTRHDRGYWQVIHRRITQQHPRVEASRTRG
jgi:hypothetical protein